VPLNYTLAYAIRKVQVNQEELKMTGTHQLLVYIENVNLMEKKHNTSTEASLKANAQKI
jgi:hypothetical protein